MMEVYTLKRLVFFLFLLVMSSFVFADDELAVCPPPCYGVTPPTRTDNIPDDHVCCSDDEYLTGYLQALVDMNYYEFEVKVVVQDRIAYVYNLPRNDLISESIVCYIFDVPCIEDVVRVDCAPDFCDNCYPTCSCISPCAEIYGIWLPQSTVLFAPLVADPRQVITSAALRFNENCIGKRVGAVSFGDDYIFYRWKDVWRWHGDLECGIEAGIFAVFDLPHPEACHVNTDFFVAALFNYAVNQYSFRTRLWHLSSHIGDEFLICHPGFDRRNLSDEGIDFFASYQVCQPIRLYAGIGYIFDRDKTFPEKPVYLEFGTEIRVFGERDCCQKLYVQPFLAMHFRTWQEHNWDVDQTYALGVEWSKIQGIGRKVRIFAEYHDGYCKEGQFLRYRNHYAALRFMYGF